MLRMRAYVHLKSRTGTNQSKLILLIVSFDTHDDSCSRGLGDIHTSGVNH